MEIWLFGLFCVHPCCHTLPSFIKFIYILLFIYIFYCTFSIFLTFFISGFYIVFIGSEINLLTYLLKPGFIGLCGQSRDSKKIVTLTINKINSL